MTEKTRFYALDGIRGLAAISVMLFHYTENNGLAWFKAAPMAVDLFFILSGFVIMHGYGDKIAQGMPFRHFLWQRILRLWPLYLVGLAAGVVAAIVQGLPGGDIAAPALLGFVILPDFNRQSWAFTDGRTVGVLFPFNAPAWSLFFEMGVNIAFFAYMAGWRKVNLKMLTALFLMIYVACVLMTGQVNPGWGIDNFYLAFPRVIAEFSFGALIYTERHRVRDLPLIVPLGLGGAVLICFLLANGEALLLNILILLPALILTASKVTLGPVATKTAAILGDISYPLYIVHVPIYALLYQILPVAGLAAPVRTVCMSVMAILASVVLAYGDKALRRRLKTLSWRDRARVDMPV